LSWSIAWPLWCYLLVRLSVYLYVMLQSKKTHIVRTFPNDVPLLCTRDTTLSLC
jgi:hypothetical protein